ncbi:MAG: cytidine deaminase [Deltaproteobacteria bacterium]|nr:cytidine deaminase [Deltaproteobacteria bacterium]
MDNHSLIEKAIEARKNAYAPYSEHRVGAVVVTDQGQLFTGCNVENCAFLGECAERVAIYKALSEGVKKIVKLVVVTANKDLSAPCGICRQVIREFNPKMEIVIANTDKKFKVLNLEELLPYSFGPESLRHGQGS